MATLPDSILALATQGADLRHQLEAWCAINSGSRHLAGLDRMRAALRSEIASAFPHATIEEPELPGTGARALRAVLRPEAPRRVLLNGHFDTVYERDDPFQATREDGPATLIGPGTADMKGGLVVLLAALRAFESTPEAAQLGVEVLLTPDEEIGSRCSKPELERSARRCIFGLVFEPARAGGEVVRERMGTGVIKVTVRGRAAHGAQPALGRNAIVALAEFLVAAHRAPEAVPGALLNIGTARGGGVINIVPDFAEAEMHARISRVEQGQALLEYLEAQAEPIRAREGYSVSLEAGFDRPPKVPGPVEERALAELNRAAADLGLPRIGWLDSGGGSDGNLLAAAGLPCLDGLGPIGGHLHSDREYVHLPSLVSRSQVAALLLQRLAGGAWSIAGRPGTT